MTLITHI